MPPLAPPKTVVVDASVLINFLHLDRLDLLSALPGLRFLIPEEVDEEIRRKPQRAVLAKGLAAGHLTIETSTDIAEIELALKLRSSLDKGESACLAMAQNRGWMIACDEHGTFVRETQRLIGAGRLLDTTELLVRAIRGGFLAVHEADAMKAVLRENHFRIPFASFADIL
jgi:predicted nucleic acid-binding protein